MLRLLNNDGNIFMKRPSNILVGLSSKLLSSGWLTSKIPFYIMIQDDLVEAEMKQKTTSDESKSMG